ncbi:MAG TPA: hypothetical protein IAB68_03135 [Candidatus Aphodocola excrementigallinarum]|uniref:Uncharacterized protein n=1 Tax=Candidatus Aphodocola excrementigallinarum TaxID=2840670 RepID=A0A9D1LIW2_9FIRM|nr:hypothetical protein [Candidatus Aphodocola excrementigallinarum]
MKKIIYIVLLAYLTLCLSGCSSWKSKIKVSELTIDDGYVVGKVKNVSNQAYDATLEFELKSGTLKLEETCYDTFKPNETKNIKCIILEDVDDTYNVKLKNIELKEKNIPTLKEGTISNNTLEYHFEEIYDKHTLNFLSISSDYDGNSYPYIDSAEYEEDSLTIKYEIYSLNNTASFTEVYDTNTNELNSFYFTIYGDLDEDFVDDIIASVSIMNSFRNTVTSSTSMLKALSEKDVDPSKCILVDNWCVSPSYEEPMYFFSINNRY